MTKLLLCSISALVVCACGVTSAFADSLTELVDKQKNVQAQVEEQEAAVVTDTSYVRKALEGTTSVVTEEDTTYDRLLSEAVAFHNFIKLINDQKEQVASFKLAVQEKELDKALVADFDSCEVDLLSPYFANPKAVWSSLKNKAQEKVQEYNLEVVAEAQEDENDLGKMLSQVDEKTTEGDSALSGVRVSSSAREKLNDLSDNYGVDTKGKTSNVSFKDKTSDQEAADNAEDIKDSDISDLAVEWQIGYAVLNSFYPNQDAVGTRKTSTTSSLPLWKDQKYLYNETIWKPKYREIVEYCEKQVYRKMVGGEVVDEIPVVLSLKEPVISDTYKYDYYFYNRVEKAHNEFVLSAEARGCVLTPAMKKAPQSAPRPLPPVYEDIMILTGADNQFTGIYPQNPMNPDPNHIGNFLTGTLWEKYKANRYKKVAKDGEFNTYFSVKSATLSPREKAEEIKGNRISKFLELNGASEKSEKIYQEYLETRTLFASSVDKFVTTHSVDLPKNLDYLNDADLDKVKNVLLERKNELIKAVKEQMGEKVTKMASMTTAQIKEDKNLVFLNALEKDGDNLVTLTRETAMTIDDAVKEAKANQKLKSLTLKNSEDYKAGLLEEKNHKANRETCLTSSSEKVLNLNAVEIK